MNTILAIETSTLACSVALQSNNQLWEEYKDAPRQHTQLLPQMIASLMHQAQLSWSQLEAIAFGQGPGSFTGLRIAAAMAQGMSWAHDIPVLKVSSFAALAHRAMRHALAHDDLVDKKEMIVGVARDAHMNHLYWGTYRCSPTRLPVPLQSDRLLPAEEKISPMPHHCIAVGDAWAMRDKFPSLKSISPVACYAHLLPSARDIIALADDLLARNETTTPQHALPVYLHTATAWQKRS